MARLLNRSIENSSFQLTSKRKRHFFINVNESECFHYRQIHALKIATKITERQKMHRIFGSQKKLKKIRYINRLQSPIMVIIGPRVFIHTTCDYTWFVCHSEVWLESFDWTIDRTIDSVNDNNNNKMIIIIIENIIRSIRHRMLNQWHFHCAHYANRTFVSFSRSQLFDLIVMIIFRLHNISVSHR